ncbi:hypothetical protein [Acanthopleuribacter pedis]|uniref:DUF2154 domain-containing protein n=1 Tax=Acanthopleuribacter pedis TaxID=442870 RepID=A0A8J7QBH9_9BACT|nr:hypothetical protein [Acanthopleuribacter pedis]MBO1321054.1 hypothetical protein [Acanthopleuribacter pedis]
MTWISSAPRALFWVVLFFSLPAAAQTTQAERDAAENRQRTSLSYGKDRNIKVHFRGRAGNIELKASNQQGQGEAVTYFQKGRGYSAFDREKQVFKWETSIPYTLNRLAGHIQKTAPNMRAEIPNGAELDFNMSINSVGYGSLNFADLNISRFRARASYGDMDINFPTVNQSIVRGRATFGLLAGDLEINNLANLKADKIKINGGVGELSVDFGPKILIDTQIKLDLDIGKAALTFPRGTQVLIRGTSRDLTQYGFVKNDKTWEPESFSPNSPKLEIVMKGPVGELAVDWK